MVRRVIEEDVAAPRTTVVEDDGSWIGRTVVTLVVLALLVAGAIWLVQSLSDNDGDGVDSPDITNNGDVNVNPDDGGDTNNDTTNQDPTTDTTVPSP